MVGVVCRVMNLKAMFCYVEMEAPLRYINGDVKYAVGSMHQELRRDLG